MSRFVQIVTVPEVRRRFAWQLGIAGTVVGVITVLLLTSIAVLS